VFFLPCQKVYEPIPPVHRWIRQMTTDYEDLPKEEKNSDRKEADRMIDIIKEA